MVKDFNDVKLEDMVTALATYQDVIQRDVHTFQLYKDVSVENLTLRQKVSTKKNRTADSSPFQTPGFQNNASEGNDGDFKIEDMNSFENFDDVISIIA